MNVYDSPAREPIRQPFGVQHRRHDDKKRERPGIMRDQQRAQARSIKRAGWR